MYREALAAIVTLLSIACSQVIKQPPQIEEEHLTVYDACKVPEFTGTLWADEVVQIYEPFIVRQIRGRIIYQNWQGSWDNPSYLPILELRDTGRPGKIRQIHCDAMGRFNVKRLPEGRYCFFASAGSPGYKGDYGMIIIDRKADQEKEIEIILGFAVPSK